MTAIDQNLMGPRMATIEGGKKQWEQIVAHARAVVSASTPAPAG